MITISHYSCACVPDFTIWANQWSSLTLCNQPSLKGVNSRINILSISSLQVYKLPFPTAASEGKLKISRYAGESGTRANVHTEPQPSSQPDVSYHIKGPVNKVYSEILLSRICVNRAVSGTIRQQWQRHLAAGDAYLSVFEREKHLYK